MLRVTGPSLGAMRSTRLLTVPGGGYAGQYFWGGRMRKPAGGIKARPFNHRQWRSEWDETKERSHPTFARLHTKLDYGFSWAGLRRHNTNSDRQMSWMPAMYTAGQQGNSAAFQWIAWVVLPLMAVLDLFRSLYPHYQCNIPELWPLSQHGPRMAWGHNLFDFGQHPNQYCTMAGGMWNWDDFKDGCARGEREGGVTWNMYDGRRTLLRLERFNHARGVRNEELKEIKEAVLPVREKFGMGAPMIIPPTRLVGLGPAYGREINFGVAATV